MDTYEKKYKEALERAKQFSEKPLLEDSAGIVEYIFPELAESEDEKIRKEMIEVIRKEAKEFPSSIIAENANSWIAWLEKQAKLVDEYEDRLDRCACESFNKGYKAAVEHQKEKQSKTSTEDFGEFINILSKQFPEVSFAKLSRIAVRVKKWFENQSEPKSYWKPTKEQYEALDYAYNSCPDTERGNYYEGVLGTLIDDLYRLEKQGQVKESVISQHENKTCKENNDSLTCEDERIRKEILLFLREGKPYYCPNSIKRQEWAAWLEKRGEKEVNEPDWCHHKVDLSDCPEEYRKAYYDGWNNCNMQHSQCLSEGNDVVKCLINGMKFYYEDNEEATWGTEKFSMKVKDILSWLEKQASPVLSNSSIIGKDEQKPAWSEEDEEKLCGIISSLAEFMGNEDKIEWLYSLRERYTWKPSKEQIIALRWVLNNVPYNKHKEEISGLLDKIKDL